MRIGTPSWRMVPPKWGLWELNRRLSTTRFAGASLAPRRRILEVIFVEDPYLVSAGRYVHSWHRNRSRFCRQSSVQIQSFNYYDATVPLIDILEVKRRLSRQYS